MLHVLQLSVTDIHVHIYVAILGRNGTLFRNTITEINVIKVLIWIQCSRATVECELYTWDKNEQQDGVLVLKKITKSEWKWLSKVGTASVLTTLVQQRFTICIVAIWRSVHSFCQPVSLQRRFSLRRFIPLTAGAWSVFILAAIHYQKYTMPNLAEVFTVPCV